MSNPYFTEYCLGFVFNASLGSVVLVHKDKGLHIGTWNGLGGKLEENEHPVDGMHREYEEESNGHKIEKWEKVGFIQGANYEVHVFTAIDTDCVDEYDAFYILANNTNPEAVFQTRLEGIERLPLAPFTMALVHLCLNKLQNPELPLITLGHASFDEEKAKRFSQGDPHRAGAALVLGIPPVDVTRDQRDKFKQAFFGVLIRRLPEIVYGMLDDVRHKNLGIPIQDVEGP